MVKAARFPQKSFYVNAIENEWTPLGADGSGKVVETHIVTHLRSPLLHPCLPLVQMLPDPMIQALWPSILCNSLQLSSKLVAIPHSRVVPSPRLEVLLGQSGEETWCPLDGDSWAVHADRLTRFQKNFLCCMWWILAKKTVANKPRSPEVTARTRRTRRPTVGTRTLLVR